jgi:Ca2+-binding RTX toxin-like protein
MSVTDRQVLLTVMPNRHRDSSAAVAASALATLALAAAWLAPPAVARVATPMCDGHAATIVGTPGPDTLDGTPGDDVIVGLGGDDVIRGHGGDDILCGGAGDDTLEGGSGNDVISGGTGDDSIIGGTGTDVISGGEGNDEIHDVVGIAEIDGGRGNDSIEVFSSAGGSFRGGPGKDDISVQGAHDRLFGGPGPDSLDLETAFWPDMVLSGGTGRDTAELDLERHNFNGPGYRVVTADLAAGTVTANKAQATLSGFENMILEDIEVNSHSEGTATSRKYVLLGTSGDNRLLMDDSGPQAVPAWVFGRGGNDVLGGGSADDLLNGGPGHDTGNGLRGIDKCVSIEVAKNCEN